MKKRKPGRPKGAGSQRIEYRVTDAQYAELKREARGDANGAAKRRAFPPPTEAARHIALANPRDAQKSTQDWI